LRWSCEGGHRGLRKKDWHGQLPLPEGEGGVRGKHAGMNFSLSLRERVGVRGNMRA